ncbi:MAG: hypothetical protein WBD40_09450 [Tepidisphaeraceae bacterium]
MSHVRFNHVFAGLLLLSLLSAFVFPKKTSGLRAHVQGIFYPVAKPARMIASALRGPFDRPDDKRPAKDIVEENHRLREALASLTGQIDVLHAMVAEGERFGDAAKYCKRVPVMGNDPASRDSLSVQGPFDPSLVNQPVLYIGGLAGRFERAGLSGAQVRLVTDRGFSATGCFGAFGEDGQGGIAFFPKDTVLPLVEGFGKGVMMIRNLKMEDVERGTIAEGAWVVLRDRDYPPLLQQKKLGKVVSIKKRVESPLWADIEVRPEWNLMALNYVMVLTKQGEQTSSEQAASN